MKTLHLLPARRGGLIRHTAMIAPVLALAGGAGAQTTIPWSTIDSGGGTSVAGALEITGTIGQPDAGESSGAGLALQGGYWAVDRRCPADVNDDGVVTTQDLFDFVAFYFGTEVALADINNDQVVSTQDIFEFLAAWFTPC